MPNQPNEYLNLPPEPPPYEPEMTHQPVGQPAPYQAQQYTPGYQPQPFQPSMPAPELMSMEEMMDIIDRRTTLATQPRVEAAERTLQSKQQAGQRTLGEVEQAYQRSLEDMRKQEQRGLQAGTRAMQARGIYDSGLAQHLGNQIHRNMSELGYQLGEDHARVLADLAEYLYLQEQHSMQEIEGIMGEKALMAQTMLDEMHQQQQTRRDQLSQREFENWLAEQAFEMNQWQANLDEYWRQTSFDASRADQEWQRWFNQEQLRVAQEQAEWERIFMMNRWEAEQELQQLLVNNQISQQEFQNALALDEFNLKSKMFQYEQRANMMSAVGNMNINVGGGGTPYDTRHQQPQQQLSRWGGIPANTGSYMTYNNQPVGGGQPGTVISGNTLKNQWGQDPWWKI